MKCSICERTCDIQEGGFGGCGMYANIDGGIRERYPDRYLAAVDTAIESMPMVHYHPRGKFLQICTVGCNFACKGCVSEMLTDHYCALEGSFQDMTPDAVIAKAFRNDCMGVMFCFNEPTVSFFTFLSLAKMAKAAGLLVGCSTNGYMTQSALEELLPFLDFVNIGLKGASDAVYRSCGVPSAAPVWRNLALLYERGVHVEVSVMFRKFEEEELRTAAARIAALSTDIPFQVMRFMPFGDAGLNMEPSVREAEDICSQLRDQLRHVYLFNSPGTEDLHSRCPDCGAKILERGFFGPMCSNLFSARPEARCECGYQLPIRGTVHASSVRESGYFGGYRTISSLNMIRAILEVLGVSDKALTDEVLVRAIKDGFIKDLYARVNQTDAYFDTVDYFAARTGRQDRGRAYRAYVLSRLTLIREQADHLSRPAVYCTLGHPRIAMFEDKLESRLIGIAGGRLTNSILDRDDRPGILISREQFNRMVPEIMIVSGYAAWPVDDVIDYCARNGLAAPALDARRVFHLHPYRASTNPDWILGLMRLANIIHPETFSFDLDREADAFYREFYGRPFDHDAYGTYPRLRINPPANPFAPAH